MTLPVEVKGQIGAQTSGREIGEATDLIQVLDRWAGCDDEMHAATFALGTDRDVKIGKCHGRANPVHCALLWSAAMSEAMALWGREYEPGWEPVV